MLEDVAWLGLGLGLVQIEEFFELVKALQLSEYFLYGSSWGACLAQEIAVTRSPASQSRVNACVRHDVCVCTTDLRGCVQSSSTAPSLRVSTWLASWAAACAKA